MYYQSSSTHIQRYGIDTTTDNQEVASRSQAVWVAVKPHTVTRVLKEIAPVIRKDQVVISVAAGITTKTLEKVNLPYIYTYDT